MNAITSLHTMGDDEPRLSLDLPATMPFDDWRRSGMALLAAHRTVKWLIGDWLIAGLERFGEKARDEAHRLAQTDIDRFGPIVATCRRFPEQSRHAALTFGHHEAVMAVSDDVEAQTMLARAEKDRMTVSALKAEVKVSTNRQTSILPDDDPEDTAYRQGIQFLNKLPKTVRRMIVEAYMETDCGVVDL